MVERVGFLSGCMRWWRDVDVLSNGIMLKLSPVMSWIDMLFHAVVEPVSPIQPM